MDEFTDTQIFTSKENSFDKKKTIFSSTDIFIKEHSILLFLKKMRQKATCSTFSQYHSAFCGYRKRDKTKQPQQIRIFKFMRYPINKQTSFSYCLLYPLGCTYYIVYDFRSVYKERYKLVCNATDWTTGPSFFYEKSLYCF